MANFELGTIFAFICLIFIFIEFARLNENNKAFKIMFFLLSLYMTIAVLEYSRQIAIINGANEAMISLFTTMHTILLFSAILVTFFTIVYFIIDGFEMLKDFATGKREAKKRIIKE